MRKRMIQIMLAVCLLLPLLAANGLAADTGGWDSLKWNYDQSSHTLTISGTGAIPDGSISDAPYHEHSDKIEKLIIEDGVTGVGKWAFEYSQKLSSVEFKGDIGDIREEAFQSCDALTSVIFRGSAGNIGTDAFWSCDKLTSVTFGGTVGEIGKSAFTSTALHRLSLPEGTTGIGSGAFNCEKLTAIYIPSSVKSIHKSAFGDALKDIYYGGTEDEWKKMESRPLQQYGLPVIHYSSTLLPETEAGSAEVLQKLLDDGRNAGLTEIELTSDIDMDGKSLYVHDKSSILLDLKGHTITSTADPVFEVQGGLTVMDSTEAGKPVVGGSNSVTYKSGSIRGTGGRVIDVLYGGSFTLESGTVRGSSDTAAVLLTGAKNWDINKDGIESRVTINGGYVYAERSPAISASGDQTYVDLYGGVAHSKGNAVLFLPGKVSDDTSSNTYVSIRGGTLINSSKQFSCGIYQADRSGDSRVYSGRILVENGAGALIRGGWLVIARNNSAEITAGGSGTGKFGGTGRELEAGRRIVLDQGEPGNRSIRCIVPTSPPEHFTPKAYPADETQEVKTVQYDDDSITYTFGAISRYMVTLDPNGCPELSVSTIETDTSGRIGSLPAGLTWEGYVFRGWSKDAKSLVGTVKDGDTIRQDTILYAIWTPADQYLITFYESDTSKRYSLTGKDGVLADWPEPHTGYTGWYTARDENAAAYPKDHVFTQDTTVYARRVSALPPYDITFRFENGSDPVTLATNSAGTLEHWPDTPKRDGYVFKGWGKGTSYTYTVDEKTVFSGDETLYALWRPVGGYAVSFFLDDPGPVTETLHTNLNLHATLDKWPRTPLERDRFFIGWYTDPSDGSRMAVDHRFTADTGAYARWIGKNAAEAAGYLVVTFDCNGGSDGGMDSIELITDENHKLFCLPYNAPVREGYTFDGWFTESDGKEVSADTVFSGTAAVRAHWTKNGTPDIPEPESFTITFNANGGTVSPAAGSTGKDGKLTALPTPVREGFTFDGWFTEPDGGGKVTTDTVFSAGKTIYALWKEPSVQTYTLTVTGGTGGGKYAAGAKAAITANAAPEGKVFDRWTSGSGGTFANADNASTTFTMPASDAAVTAVYRDVITAPEQTACVVYFDPRGGIADITSMVTKTDGTLPSLPLPFYYGYLFSGWYTEPLGGNPISTNTVFSRNAVVYAHWVPAYYNSGSSIDSRPSPLAEYAVTAPSADGGRVTVSREYASEGTSISVTVTPDSGYELTSLVARDSWWNELSLADRGGGRYTLTMPNKAITINAVFTAAAQQSVSVPVSAPAARPGLVWSYPGFTDVSAGAWYYEAVGFVCGTGLMKGVSGARFSPDTNLSRAQLTQILYNMAGSPAVGFSGFTDVAPGDWYANAAAWAEAWNLIDGYAGGRFGPDDPVTREEIVLMLWRYAGKPASTRELHFTDTSNVSTYALTAVRWAVEKGILNGNSDGSLALKGLATRAQVAQMLRNYLSA